MTQRFIDDVPSRLTQEQKDLLLDDLCARLPFNVRMYDIDVTLPKTDLWLRGLTYEGSVMVGDDGRGLACSSVGAYLPYLFPLSSMTEEQKKELRDMDWSFDNSTICNIIECIGIHRAYVDHSCCSKLIYWCIKNHFDYRGLIPMGLAKDATGLNIY